MTAGGRTNDRPRRIHRYHLLHRLPARMVGKEQPTMTTPALFVIFLYFAVNVVVLAVLHSRITRLEDKNHE